MSFHIKLCSTSFILMRIKASQYYSDVPLSLRWRATEGDHALCECCDSEDCLRPTGVGNTGDTVHKTSPHKGFPMNFTGFLGYFYQLY